MCKVYNGILNDFDQAMLDQRKTGPGVPAPLANRQIFDFDNDGDIDNDDHIVFLEGYVGNAPTIPATSTWGLVVLALGSLIAGTVVLSRRRKPTETSPDLRQVL